MKILKNILTALLLLLIILALVGFILPQKQQVERSLEISASADKIYPYLANPKLFQKWSPWSKMDPNLKVQFTGPESGKGAGMTWQSKESNVGSGSWVISEAIENQSLNVNMDFGDQGAATSFFTLQPSAGKTNVTWGFETDAGMNPIMRWFGLLMDKMVGGEYAKGLQTLKDLLEK